MNDPGIKEFLGAWQQAWAAIPANAPIESQRQVFEQFANQTKQPLAKGLESVLMTVNNGARPVRVRVFRPHNHLPIPALIFMHGGSWTVGSPETHYRIAAEIAMRCYCTVISVDYSLVPEYKFPAGLEDCEEIVKWAFANAKALRIDPMAISVGGESAGANLAAALTLKFRGTVQKFSKQLLFYPPLDFAFSRSSFLVNADGPLLTTAGIKSAMCAYVPDTTDRKNPLAAPLQAVDKSGLPPMFMAVAEHDPLHDDGIEYARQLALAGVDVCIHEGKSLIHGYANALPYSSAARDALNVACNWLRTDH